MDAILTALIEGLRAKGFLVRRARPGIRGPRVAACCGALGLKRLTVKPGGNAEAEVFIQVYGPGKSGAAACEQEAEAMAGALAAGLSSGLPALLCTAGECSYDGAGNFFTQRLTVSVPVDLRGGRAVVRSPAAIKKGDVTAALVTSWKAEVRQSVEPVYTFGAAGSVGTVAGRRVYELELEGILPQEGQNPGNLAEFSLAVPGGVYTGCTWKCFTRTETAAGMTVRGQALARGRQGG